MVLSELGISCGENVTVKTHERQRVLDLVYAEAFDSESLQDRMKRHGVTPRELESYLKRLGRVADIRNIATSSYQYHYDLALMAALFPGNVLPQDLREQINPTQAPLDASRVTPYHPDWYLCSTSEMRMRESIASGAFLVEEGKKLIVKFEGRISALVYSSVGTDNSVFVENVWYAPGKELRPRLHDAARSGERVIKLSEGEWFPMRAVNIHHSGGRMLVPYVKSTIEQSLEGSFTPRRPKPYGQWRREGH